MVCSALVSEAAMALHKSAIIIDGTTFFIEGYTDYLEQAGVTALNITVPDVQDDEGGAVRSIAAHYQLVREDPRITLIETVDDIHSAKREGKVGVIIGFQNARPMNYSLTMVELFWRLGARIVQLAYNDRNFAADGCDCDGDAGLSREGRALVREFGQVGIVLDLSHVGERSATEAIELSDRPVIFSHSNPRARCPMPRNITDEQIKVVAERGGVIGLTPHPPLNWNGGPEPPRLSDYLDNIEYVVQLAGIDHASIATDSEATPDAYSRELRRRLGKKYGAAVGGYKQRFFGREDAKTLGAYRNMSDLPVITQGLLDRGYDEESVRKILGLNLVRVFEAVWK